MAEQWEPVAPPPQVSASADPQWEVVQPNSGPTSWDPASKRLTMTFGNQVAKQAEIAASPFTRMPQAYLDLVNEAQRQMSTGVEQLQKEGAWEKVKGAGNVAGGAINYAMSPINAPIRTIVGEPIENTTGIPKEYPEFAASLAIPGIGLARTGAGQQAIAGAKSAGKTAEKIFSPDTVDAAAQSIAGDLRAAGGQAARDTITTDAKLEPFRAMVNQMDDPSKLNFVNHVEGAAAGPLPQGLKNLADTMRREFDLRMAKIQALPSKMQTDFIEDYFPHFWKDQQAAQQFAQNFGVSRQGSGASLRKRTVPTIADGIAAGLQPAVIDPVEATMRYVSSMDRFIASTKVLDDAKAAGVVRYIRPQVMGASGHPAGGIRVPPGYVPLKGRGATDAVGAKAYAPENWARVYNNYISRGFHEIGTGEYGKAYDTARRGANAITALELGLSGYHALTMAKEGIVNGVARGVTELAAGRPVAAAKSLVTAPATMITNAVTGRRLAKIYKGQSLGTAKDRQIVDLLTEAGGRGAGYKHAADYEFSGAGSYVTAWKRAALALEMKADLAKAKTGVLPAAGIAGKQIGRIMDTVAQPLFEKYIPYMKNGAFKENMASWLDAHPAATRQEQVAAARKIWDSIDNRFGEMVQDNVFWDKTLKQSAMLALRSWSWTIGGVVREIGGGLRDTGRFATGKGGWTDKMSYVIALPMVDAGVNAVYQYLKTGKPPEDIHDLMAPRTGGVDAKSGLPERLQTPGYMKDVYGFAEHPLQEATNKIGTGPRMAGEHFSLLNGMGGSDWRGDPILSPPAKDEPLTNNVPQWLVEYMQYLTKNVGPISVRQYIQGKKEGSNLNWLEQALGVKTAPRQLIDPEGHHTMMERVRDRKWRTKQRFDRRQEKLYGGPQ